MIKLKQMHIVFCILITICFTSSLVMAVSPTAPVITQLPPETYSTSVTVNWTAASAPFGIYRYFVQKSTDPYFLNDMTITDAGNTLNYTYSGLLYNTYYYFRVYAQGIDLDPDNTNPWDPVTNPQGTRWSAITRTRCIPAPANSLSQPTISEISPGIYNAQDDTYYTTSRNPAITWTTPGNWPQPNLAPTYIKVTGGTYFSIGLKSDGTIWTWGSNQYGQLGNGTTCDRNIPWVVKMADGTNLSNIIAIAGGGYHALALKSDGTVWTWGYNNKGQLGDGTLTNRGNPVQVKLSSGMILEQDLQYYH